MLLDNGRVRRYDSENGAEEGKAIKIYTVVGGVDGVGKSSLLGILKAERMDLGFLADAAVERIENALAEGVNLTQETTLAGGYPKRLAKRAKEAGYYVRLYYVGLDGLEEALRRIENRVAKGGHDIPRHDVERRFQRRFRDVWKVLPYCDEAKFFDNNNGFSLVAEYRNGEVLPLGADGPQWLQELLRAEQK